MSLEDTNSEAGKLRSLRDRRAKSASSVMDDNHTRIPQDAAAQKLAQQEQACKSKQTDGQSEITVINTSQHTNASGEILSMDEIAKLAEVRQSLQSTGPAFDDKTIVGDNSTPLTASCNSQKQQMPLPDGAPKPGAYSGAPGKKMERNSTAHFSLLGIVATTGPMEDTSDNESLVSILEEDKPSQSAHDYCEERQSDNQLSEGSNRVSFLTNTSTCSSNSQPLPPAQNDHTENPMRNSVTRTQSGLAVAELVEEDGTSRDLPMAAEFDMVDSLRRKEESMKQLKRKMQLAVILVAVAVAVVVLIAVVVTRKETRRQDARPSMGTPSTMYMRPSDVEAMEDSLLQILPEETVETIKRQPQSPQSKAFQWLVDDIGNQTSLYHDRIMQRFALVTLYYATNGESWTDRRHWLNHSIHECDWYNSYDFGMKKAVSVSLPGYLEEMFPPTDLPPTMCHDNGMYKNLWLNQNNLVGTIPDELFWLITLETLSLGLNSLYGTIPSSVGRLAMLQGLAIMLMENGGAIPREISLLSNLRALVLSDNNHSGPIPKELWQMSNLQSLILSNMPDLQGTIPAQIGNFAKLRWFVIDDCGLTGAIPTELGQLQHLEWISLNGNMLTGAVPSQLGMLPSILLMLINQNSLAGTLPSELGLLTSLTLLQAGETSISGSIPSEYGLMISITVGFNVGKNRLTGTIPSELSNLVSAKSFSLEENSLNGPIPSEFGKLSSVERLLFANNSLSGTVPWEVSVLQGQSLHTLTIEGNPLLTGVIPEGLCNINVTCVPSSLLPCSGPHGLSFDCSRDLCGCGCSCGRN
ncbi:LRR receptor-like serine threonine-protein kinase [Seminavis robusta]|uniref:LRR receptor-like serine threonine-protein kinase n=1 Tax=Seminavis robusta TaxID=568900 RepID=A0A9N8F1G3_9STRA|nr:LRR receptor-like serine threonine-protein kinase [Seminavis robusta]|eukprot:Sro2587_g331930.1 LRR receptor-like serine threonine-protein kinase (808) ;mRNA; f:5115-7608